MFASCQHVVVCTQSRLPEESKVKHPATLALLREHGGYHHTHGMRVMPVQHYRISAFCGKCWLMRIYWPLYELLVSMVAHHSKANVQQEMPITFIALSTLPKTTNTHVTQVDTLTHEY